MTTPPLRLETVQPLEQPYTTDQLREAILARVAERGL